MRQPPDRRQFSQQISTPASFLEEYRVSASTHDLTEAKILASLGASEETLCAAIYLPKHFGQPYYPEALNTDITDCSDRLGIEPGRLDAKLEGVGKIITAVQRAKGVGLAELTRPRWFSREFNDYHDSECRFEVNDEQILNLIGMMRNILKTRESKMLFAAVKLQQLKELLARGQAPSEMLEKEYFLQVLPVVEGLDLPYLSEKLKDAFFSLFNPDWYGRISEWFRLYFRSSPESMERKLENVSRLIREVGARTGLLPEGTIIKWRVKTPFSIAEKMLNDPLPDGSLPMLHDILGLRIIVPGEGDISRVVELLKGTFKTVPEALNKLTPWYAPRLDTRLTKDFDYERTCYPGEARYWYLKTMDEFIQTELQKKGYVDGVKDGFQNVVRVAYHYRVMTTYEDLPMEVQITTREMEEKNEEQYPHWAYKYDRQLRLGKWAESVKAADLQAERPGIYVVNMDERERRIWVDQKEKREEWYVSRPGEESMRSAMARRFISRDWNNGPEDLEDGFVLFRPTSEHDWEMPDYDGPSSRPIRLELYLDDWI